MSRSGSGVHQVARPSRPSPFVDGAAVSVGSLPHTDAVAAAAFSIAEFDIATIPSLPTRSTAESMVAQALSGVPGVGFDPDGGIRIDVRLVDPDHPVSTDLLDDAFVGTSAFLDLARTVNLDGAPVKWQIVGPVTLGVELHRAGLDRVTAFRLAANAVGSRITDLTAAVSTTLPSSPQLAVLDEPWLAQVMAADFPIPPDEAIDLMSGALATLPTTTLGGIHCCAPCDIATVLAAGPGVLSVPATPDLLDWSGYLTRFIDGGGVVAWGAVPTEGPVPSSADRSWRQLSDLWCGLVQNGCDAVQLRRRSLVTPHCGLSRHSVSVARRLARLTGDVGKRVKDQSMATRFALGA